MKYWFFLGILFLSSCSKQEGVSFKLSDLLSVRGPAKSQSDSRLNPAKEFYFYEDSKYQIDKESKDVEAKFSTPSKNENLINYWKDKYRAIYYKIEKNDGGMDELSMVIPSTGERIIYSSNGHVKWIVKRGEL